MRSMSPLVEPTASELGTDLHGNNHGIRQSPKRNRKSRIFEYSYEILDQYVIVYRRSRTEQI